MLRIPSQEPDGPISLLAFTKPVFEPPKVPTFVEKVTKEGTAEFVSPIDGMCSIGVGVLAMLPVGAVSGIVELFGSNPQIPWIGWFQTILKVICGFVVLLSMFT